MAASPAVELTLPLGATTTQFELEKVVCSHGLFMMSPNQWDPLSKTLVRPLYSNSSEESQSLLVAISQPTSQSLLLRVYGVDSLSPSTRQSIIDQVRRMLRLSEEEDRNVEEFHRVYGEAKDRGFGRVFRSPTLFEDMVKCILFCNCQWPRTLSMARALCELKLEMQCTSSSVSIAGNNDKLSSLTVETEQFYPKTPAGKESRKKIRMQENLKNIVKRSSEVKALIEGDAPLGVDFTGVSDSLQEKHKCCPGLISSTKEEEFHQKHDGSFEISSKVYEVDSSSFAALPPTEKAKLHSCSSIGNFPSPKDIASLDVNFLAKRCNLGYRARRISNLARDIVDGRIQLGQLEEDCGKGCLSNYSKVAEQLRKIDGFGPFTCANVLMCMGFYHVIPSDSETLRHLKQFHRRTSTTKSIQHDIETIYGKYAPFQFLVYWSEIWSFYEERFGKLSELPDSHYKLITAANMRCRDDLKRKGV